MKKSGVLLFFVILILYLASMLLHLNGIFDNELGLNLLKIQLIALFGTVLLFAIKKFGIYSSWSLFLLAFFLFNLSRFFLDILGIASVSASDKYVFYTISRETIITILNSYVVFLIFYLLSMIVIKQNKNALIRIANSPNLEKATSTILLLVAPFVAVKLINDIIQVLSNSYFSLYSNNSSTFRLLNPFWFVFYFTVPIYLASIPKKKYKNLIIFIIVIIIVLDSMKGSRGALFRPLLFIVWYYALLGKKLSTKTSILAVVLTPIVSNLYVFFREGGIVIKSFLSSFYTFLYSQGVTAIFFANFLDYRDGFSRNTRFYFLSGFIEPVRRYITQRTAYSSGRSQRFVDVTYSLDHKLMYEISPELYAQGVGFGSNIVAEFYAFGGYIGIAILTILLCYLINLFENKSRINRVMLIVSFYWVQNLIWAPRGTMLPNPIFILLSLIIYYFINTVVNKNDGNFKKSKEGVS